MPASTRPIGAPRERVLCLALGAMATRFELVLPLPRGASRTDAARLRAAGEAALAEVETCDRRLSLFRRDSLLAHVNRSAASDCVRVDPDTFGLLETCADVWRASSGAFDPTVAPLSRAFGLHGPPEGDVAAARERVGWQHVELDPRRRAVRFRRGGVTLDLGGVAKGLGLDLAARVLREAGVRSALLHGGTSSVLAIGRPPGRQGFGVALGPGPGARTVRLTDGALSVSGSHGRTVEHDGRPVGHVLDPLGSGAPARGLAVALAASATLADAWSTAKLLAGDALGDREDVRAWIEPGDAEATR